MKTLAEGWQDLAMLLARADVGPRAIEQARMAYYFGASSALNTIAQIATLPAACAPAAISELEAQCDAGCAAIHKPTSMPANASG